MNDATTHTAWCTSHNDAGPGDQWCRTEERKLEPAGLDPANPADAATVEVSVESHRDRMTAPTVYLFCSNDGGIDLRPDEARQLAHWLLAGADLAAGVTNAW